MQEENTAFLSYFFTEPIYAVKHEKQAINRQAHYPEQNLDKVDHKQQLVEETKEIVTKSEAVEPKPAPRPLSYSGKNLKKVLIIFENKISDNLDEEEKTFLGKVLQAVQLNFDDIALLNISLVEEASFDQINNFDALIQISLGVEENLLTFNADLPYYDIVNKNNVNYLLTDNLKEIQAKKEKKVLLWNNLQKLFIKS